MNEEMWSGVWAGVKSMEPARRPLVAPGPGEARLRIEACGICGSDLHIYRAPDLVPEGTTLGHEMVGVVESVGDEVSEWRAGDRVTVEPLISCGRCEMCLQGYDNRCPEYGIIGMHQPGGFSEQIIVPARRLYKVSEALAAPVAALSEPVAVVVHGLQLGGFTPGQQVLVLGGGTIGLLTVAVARLWGAGDIVLTARHPHQVELGRRLGASEVFAPEEVSPTELPQLLESRPPDLVVETVGGEADTLAAAGAAVAPGGTVVVLGVFTAEIRLAPMPLLKKEVCLRWSLCYTRSEAGADFSEAIGLITAHPELFGSLLTHELPLAEIGRGFAIADDKSSGAIKVTVVP